MKIKLHILSNGKSRGLGTFRSILDFFFPYYKYDKNGVGIIRREAGGMGVKGENIIQEFYTFRSFLIYLSTALSFSTSDNTKKIWAERFREFGYIPRMGIIGAVGYVATGSGVGQSGTSVTYSNQAFGVADCAIIGTIQGTSGTDDITGLTFNSNSATRVNGTKQADDPEFVSVYAIGGANASGTHDVVISVSASRGVNIIWATYSGTNVNTTGSNLDANDVANSNVTVASFSKSLTTVADNCWLAMVAWGRNSTTTTAGANTTVRTTVSGYDNTICDSNAAKTPAGSHSLALNFSPNSKYAAVIVSIPPLSAGVAFTPKVIIF